MNFWERNNDAAQNGGNNSQNGAYGKYYDNQATNEAQNIADNPAFDALDPNMREKLKQYGNMDQNELTAKLLSVANEMKRDGRFDAAALDNFFAQCSPFMNAEQLAKMRSLINMLK